MNPLCPLPTELSSSFIGSSIARILRRFSDSADCVSGTQQFFLVLLLRDVVTAEEAVEGSALFIGAVGVPPCQVWAFMTTTVPAFPVISNSCGWWA